MKHLQMKAWLCLSSILLILYGSYAQNHYIKSASVAGIEVRQGGGENSICPTYSSHFSTNNTTDKFYFTSMVCLASYVKLEIFNPTSGTIKATLTTTYGVGVETKTIAAGSSSGILVIPYDASYNWKFESVATLPQFIADTLRTVASVNKYVFPRVNDIAIPANTNYRVKAGQTLTLGTLTADNSDYSFLFRPTSVGTQTVIVELYNASTNAVVGESNLNIIVTQNCALGITSITRVDAKNYDVAITYNSFVEPYKWELYNSAGLKVKTGTTVLNGDPGLKRIFIDDVPSGIYDFRLSSVNSNCGVVSKQFSYGNAADVCTMSASAVRAGNYYNVNIAPITGVSGIYYTLTNALDSVITEGIVNSGVALNLNFTGKAEGQYFLSLNPANSTKICFQKLSLPWVIAQTVNNRGYLKKYNNVPDYYEMAGVGDYGGTKDAGTGWVVKENRSVMLWQTYVKALSNSTGAKALITLRQDSASNSKHYSLSFEKGKFKLISRTAKGGQNTIVIEIATTLESGWLRFERNGNNLIAKISDSAPDSDNPVFSTLYTINNAFAGWTLPFWKGLYVSSGSSTTLASAEFHRFLGGPYTGTSATVDNTPLSPPIIASSSLNPTANASVSFSSSACKSGFLIQYYKNGLPVSQGANYTVSVVYGDAYKAKCEKGTEKSAFSNTITFTAPSTTAICGIEDNLKLGVKTVGPTTTYNMYARIFNNKLWLTQSLGTTPESFIVRGVNFISITFVKSWTGSDYSCFEGQTTGYGGAVEPSNFTTPTGYTLSTTADGAHIYTLGVVAGNGTGTGIAGRMVAPAIPIMPPVNQWNRFYTTSLDSVTIPQKFNAVFGENRDVVSMIWHYPYRNLFAYDANVGETNPARKAARELAEMRRVGIKVINANYLVSCVEMDNDERNCLPTPPINAFKDVVVGKGMTDDSGIQGWNDWINFWRDPVWAQQRFHAPIVNGKYNLFMMCYDYEASHTRSDRQEDVNYQVVAAYAQDEVINGWVGQMYLSPKNSLAYVNSALFTSASNTPAWFNVADSSVPERFRGKKISGNPKFYGMTEQAHYQESMKPEGYVLKDQNGNNWLTLTHFGNAEGTGINKNSTPNIEHWQTQIIGLGQANAIECNKTGQPFFYQLKLDNQRGDGYFYSPEAKSYNDNKYNGEYNRYGILNCDFPDGAAGNGYDGQNDCILTTAGSERAPAYIQEGQTIFSIMLGAKGIQVWGSSYDNEALPKTKTGNPQRGDRQLERNYGNNDLEGVGYTVRGWNRLAQKHIIQNSTIGYSVFDLVAETDTKYLNDATEYSVNGGVTWYSGNALIYQKNRIPATLAMVNDRLGIIAIATQEAYNECSTQGITMVKVRYNGNIYNIEILPNNVPNIALYKIGTTVTVETGAVTPPVINSNPTNPQAGTAVTFSTSSGCAGTIKWWSGDAQLGTGSSYTVSSPVVNDSYFATCTVGTTVSLSSNLISIAANSSPPSSSVTVTVPTRAAYYYSDGHAPSYYDDKSHLPAIFTNSATYDEADLVTIKNGDVEFKINLKRGGQICYASKAGVPINRVYNGSDGGLQWQYDATQYLVGGKLNGIDPGSPQNNINYNTTMGGDYNNNAVSLIDYHPVTNGYYLRFRPNLYNFNATQSQIEIEVTYTIVGKSLKADYKYTSFRTDTSLETGNLFRFVGFHVPICFLTNNFTKYAIYTGDSPWTNTGDAGLTMGDIPNITGGAAQPYGYNTKEFTGIAYDPSNNFAVGVMNNSEGAVRSVTYEQLNKYSGGSAGTVFSGPYTTMALAESFSIPNGGNYVRQSTAYFTLGDSVGEVRNELKARAGH